MKEQTNSCCNYSIFNARKSTKSLDNAAFLLRRRTRNCLKEDCRPRTAVRDFWGSTKRDFWYEIEISPLKEIAEEKHPQSWGPAVCVKGVAASLRNNLLKNCNPLNVTCCCLLCGGVFLTVFCTQSSVIIVILFKFFLLFFFPHHLHPSGPSIFHNISLT